MCPIDVPPPLLTLGQGEAILLVATCQQTPNAQTPEGRAGTSIRVVRQQKLAHLVATAKLHVDSDTQQITLTAQGGSPWHVEYDHVVRVRDDGNGVAYLTFSAAQLPMLQARPWMDPPIFFSSVFVVHPDPAVSL